MMRSAIAKFAAGLRLPSALILFLACSSSTTTTDGTVPGSTGGSGSLAAACDKAKERATKCAVDGGSMSKQGEEDCDTITSCFGAAFRAPLGQEMADCYNDRGCYPTVKECSRKVAAAHASEDGIGTRLSRCSSKGVQCNTEKFRYLDGDDCDLFVLVRNRDEMATCLDKPCNEVPGCLVSFTRGCWN